MTQPKVLRANLIRTIRSEKLFTKDDHVLVAVSGGQDSLYLLKWLTEGTLPADIQPTVSAGYVNHQLRTDATAEEALVARVFSQTPRLQNKLMTRLEWLQQPSSGLEEAAREKRYAQLMAMAEKVGANLIVTAHHQDDQVETILYKLARGSRLSQLTGMADKQPFLGGVPIVRPFLNLPKGALDKLVNEPLNEWVEDYTNMDETYARNRMRQTVVPALTAINQQASEHIVAFANQLAGLEKLATGALKIHVQALEMGRLDWQADDGVLLLVLQSWLAKKMLFNVKDRQLEQAVQLMRNPNVNTGSIALGGHLYLERIDKQLQLVKKS